MKKIPNPAVAVALPALSLIETALTLVDRLLNAYERKKELEFEMLKERTKNEQELRRLENSRIELIQIHKENMKKLDELGKLLESALLNDEAARQVFIQRSNLYLDMQKKLNDAAIEAAKKDDDKDTWKALLEQSLQYGKLLQIAVDNFHKENTKHYVEGSAILRSIPLNNNSIKVIGEE